MFISSLVLKDEVGDVEWLFDEEDTGFFKMLTEYSGGAGEAYATDKGDVRLTLFVHEVEYGEDYIENPVNVGFETDEMGRGCAGITTVFRKPKDYKWDYAQFVFGEDKIHDTSFSITCPEILPLRQGDVLLWIYGYDNDSANVGDEGVARCWVDDRDYATDTLGTSNTGGYDSGIGVSIARITNPEEGGGNPRIVAQELAASTCGAMIALRLRAVAPPPAPPRRIRSTGVPADPKPPERLLMRTDPSYDFSVSNPPTSMCNCGLYSVYVGNANDALGLIHRCYGCRRPVARCTCG